MSGKFQPINRDTAYLLPPLLQDWLPENPGRFIFPFATLFALAVAVTASTFNKASIRNSSHQWLDCEQARVPDRAGGGHN